MSQPSKITEGKSTAAMVNQYDFMTTLLDYIGLNNNEDNLSPGRIFTNVLFEQHNEVQDEVVIFDEYGPMRMIRNYEWKYIHRYPYGPPRTVSKRYGRRKTKVYFGRRNETIIG